MNLSTMKRLTVSWIKNDKKSMKSAQARNLRKRIIQITDTQSKREIKPIFLL